MVADLPEHVQRQISVEVTRGGQISGAALINLSLSGVLIAHLGFAVAVGDTVAITVDYAGRSATLAGAIVRTVEEGAVGIHFPESIRDGEFDPPVRLANIHRSLERLWLKHREK